MTNYSEKAMDFFKQGYNCAQSVVLAFCDKIGLETETALKLSSSFGGGMGRLREVCGAVSGMFMVTGMLYGYADPKDTAGKTELYTLVQALGEKFKEENGSIICRDLLGLREGADKPVPEARTPEYYKKRPCVELVGCAARILEEYIQSRDEKCES